MFFVSKDNRFDVYFITQFVTAVRQEVNNSSNSTEVHKLELAIKRVLYVFYEAQSTSTKWEVCLDFL